MELSRDRNSSEEFRVTQIPDSQIFRQHRRNSQKYRNEKHKMLIQRPRKKDVLISKVKTERYQQDEGFFTFIEA